MRNRQKSQVLPKQCPQRLYHVSAEAHAPARFRNFKFWHSSLIHGFRFPFPFTWVMYPTAAFRPTPEQLALREARQLKKQNATTNAGVASSIRAKGQIIERPWLTVQDPSKALQSVRILTWNVRNFSVVCTASVIVQFFAGLMPLFSALSSVSCP